MLTGHWFRLFFFFLDNYFLPTEKGRHYFARCRAVGEALQTAQTGQIQSLMSAKLQLKTDACFVSRELVHVASMHNTAEKTQSIMGKIISVAFKHLILKEHSFMDPAIAAVCKFSKKKIKQHLMQTVIWDDLSILAGPLLFLIIC